MAPLTRAFDWLFSRKTAERRHAEWSSLELAALSGLSEHRCKAAAAVLAARGTVEELRRDEDGTRWYRATGADQVREWRESGHQARMGGNAADYLRLRAIREAVERRIAGGHALQRADAGVGQVGVVIRGEPGSDHQALYPVAVIAETLRVTPKTVRLWCRRGWVRSVRVSERTIRIPHDEYQRLLGKGSLSRPVQRYHVLQEIVGELVNAS